MTDAGSRVQSLDNTLGNEVMKRRVEEGKRRPLAGAVERTAGRQLLATFNVTGRQRPKRACDFGRGEVGEMPLVQGRKPGVE